MEGITINVSESGMYAFAAANLMVGDEVNILFRPIGRKESIRTCGIVRRRAVYLYGIEFLPADIQTKTATDSQFHPSPGEQP